MLLNRTEYISKNLRMALSPKVLYKSVNNEKDDRREKAPKVFDPELSPPNTT
jgi:hypothetical protein